MRNENVVKEWTAGRAARSSTGNLHTDGHYLYSYNLLIGFTVNGSKVVYDYTRGGEFGFVSMTTSKHVGLAKRAMRR